MDFTKFLMVSFWISTLASANSEFIEIREARLQRPRADSATRNVSTMRVGPIAPHAQRDDQRTCWSFFTEFCSLMQYATPHYPSMNASERNSN